MEQYRPSIPLDIKYFKKRFNVLDTINNCTLNRYVDMLVSIMNDTGQAEYFMDHNICYLLGKYAVYSVKQTNTPDTSTLDIEPIITNSDYIIHTAICKHKNPETEYLSVELLKQQIDETPESLNQDDAEPVSKKKAYKLFNGYTKSSSYIINDVPNNRQKFYTIRAITNGNTRKIRKCETVDIRTNIGNQINKLLATHPDYLSDIHMLECMKIYIRAFNDTRSTDEIYYYLEYLPFDDANKIIDPLAWPTE